MIRKVHYAIIHIPLPLIDVAKEVINKKGIKPSHLIFSTNHTSPSTKTVTLEDTSLELFKKQGQNAVALHLPIKETNKHSKLPFLKIPDTYIRIDLYFSPSTQEVAR